MEEPDGVGLTEALELLRADLAAAHLKSVDEDVQFPVEGLTIELKVGITKSGGGKVGFRVPFLGAEAGIKGGYDKETTQTITLELGPPVDKEGRTIKVAHGSDDDMDG